MTFVFADGLIYAGAYSLHADATDHGIPERSGQLQGTRDSVLSRAGSGMNGSQMRHAHAALGADVTLQSHLAVQVHLWL